MRENIRWILRLISKYKALAFAVCLIGVLQTIAKMTSPWLRKILIDDVLLSSRTQTLPYLGVLFILALMFELGMMMASAYMSARFGQQVALELRRMLFSKYRQSSFEMQRRHKPGTIISHSMADVSAVASSIENGVAPLFTACSGLIVNMLVLVILDYRLLLLASCFLPFYLYGPMKLTPRLYQEGERVQESTAQLNSVMQDSLAGTLEVASIGVSQWDISRFLSAARRLMQAYLRQVVAFQGMMVSVFGPLILSQYRAFLTHQKR